MNTALLYRPQQRWQIWVALAAAVLLHVGAVAIAKNQPAPPPRATVQSEVTVVLEPPGDPSPPPPEEDPPPAPPQPVSDDLFVVEQNPTPPPIRKRSERPPPPLVRAGAPQPASMSSARVLAVSAPRPEYPYEARRQRITGSGLAVLTIDPASGSVLDVSLVRSTGSAVLDNATISGFRRWRFKPGTVSRVQTPITYTLTGASY